MPLAPVVARAREHDVDVAEAGVADEALLAVEHPGVAVALRARLAARRGPSRRRARTARTSRALAATSSRAGTRCFCSSLPASRIGSDDELHVGRHQRDRARDLRQLLDVGAPRHVGRRSARRTRVGTREPEQARARPSPRRGRAGTRSPRRSRARAAGSARARRRGSPRAARAAHRSGATWRSLRRSLSSRQPGQARAGARGADRQAERAGERLGARGRRPCAARPAAIGAAPVEPVEQQLERRLRALEQRRRGRRRARWRSSASGIRVGEQPRVGDRRHRVALAVHDERRRLDARRAARSCRGRRTPTSAPTTPCGGARWRPKWRSSSRTRSGCSRRNSSREQPLASHARCRRSSRRPPRAPSAPSSPQRRPRRARAARRRAAEHQPAHPLGEAERQLLGDHPAHREPVDVRALDAERVEQPAPRRRRARPSTSGAAARPSAPEPRLS